MAAARGEQEKPDACRNRCDVSMSHFQDFAKTGPLALYLHVPYCRRRCSYCDFNAHVLPEGVEDPFGDYARALLQDIEQQESASLSSIFWGGGTPSLLPEPWLRRVTAALCERFDYSSDTEHTIEANPGTVSARKFEAFLECGINRLSLGAQSFQAEQLELVGRIHSSQQITEAVHLARQAGFENLSLDLIYGFPEQSVEHWRETLERALELEPEHLSVYQLTVEPSTRLEAQLEQGLLSLPPEETMLAMDDWAEQTLSEAGFERYEISNWAKPGLQCRHNLHYWRDLPYLGLGCGGVSFLNGWRAERIKAPVYYQRALEQGRSPVVFAERRGADGALKDHLMMALRVTEGVLSEELCHRYPGLTSEHLKAFFERLPQDWWSFEGGRYRLSRRGWDFHSEVVMELMNVLFSFS